MSERNELALIDWFRRRVGSPTQLEVGIGDDAAVWRTSGERLLFTTDVLMDEVDFRLSEVTARQIGRKSLAVNLSDISAMAGQPLAALVGLALPKVCGFEFARELLDGLNELAIEFDTSVIGGDTNTWDGPLVVSITLIGATTGRGAVLRSGARPGDWLFVTGPLGGSILGHHLDFTPRIREALQLHQAIELHAMIDLSDGLAADLHHLLEKSGVGAVLIADTIPISAAARSISDGREPLVHALNDGEDFELLFAVSPDDGRRLLAGVSHLPVFHIGEIDAAAGARLKLFDGKILPLDRGGWEHIF